MEIEKVLELFRKYVDSHKVGGYPSLQIFRDGSGAILDSRNKEIPGTGFGTTTAMIERLTTPTELEKAEDKYLSELLKFYPQGTKIRLEVRSQSVEVTVYKP
jgi:hypothetical protein